MSDSSHGVLDPLTCWSRSITLNDPVGFSHDFDDDSKILSPEVSWYSPDCLKYQVDIMQLFMWNITYSSNMSWCCWNYFLNLKFQWWPGFCRCQNWGGCNWLTFFRCPVLRVGAWQRFGNRCGEDKHDHGTHLEESLPAFKAYHWNGKSSL